MAGEADVGNDVLDDVTLPRNTIASALPAATDYNRAVRILLQRQETGSNTYLGAHDGSNALRD